MKKTKNVNIALSRLNTYFITLIITTSIFLLINTITALTSMGKTVAMTMWLLTWIDLIASAVMLILSLIELIWIHREKPEYRFNIQYIIVSIILGALVLYIILGLALGNHKTSNINDGNVTMKIAALITTIFIIGIFILFYGLSLKKTINTSNSMANTNELNNDETPKKEWAK